MLLIVSAFPPEMTETEPTLTLVARVVTAGRAIVWNPIV